MAKNVEWKKIDKVQHRVFNWQEKTEIKMRLRILAFINTGIYIYEGSRGRTC